MADGSTDLRCERDSHGHLAMDVAVSMSHVVAANMLNPEIPLEEALLVGRKRKPTSRVASLAYLAGKTLRESLMLQLAILQSEASSPKAGGQEAEGVASGGHSSGGPERATSGSQCGSHCEDALSSGESPKCSDSHEHQCPHREVLGSCPREGASCCAVEEEPAGKRVTSSDEDDDANVCGVCLDKTVGVICSPCGHEFCMDCAGLLCVRTPNVKQPVPCPFCRAPVSGFSVRKPITFDLAV